LRRDAVALPGVIDVKAQVFAPTLLIRHHAWITWTQIAIEHEDHSWRGRLSLVATRDMARMEDEFKPALVAVTAASFALDALYGVVRNLIPLAPSRARPRWATIFETLKRGVSKGAGAASWLGEFKWLFKTRDESVHFGEAMKAPVPHPMGGTNVAPEMATWSAESATHAVDLLVSVLSAWIESPTHTTKKWASDLGQTVRDLVDLRARLAHDRKTSAG
jgi:hypothetical protein